MLFFFNITICYWISIDIDFKLLTDCIFLPNNMQYLLLPNSYVNIHERLLLDVQQNPFSSKHLRGTELTLVVNTSSRSLPIHNISCLWRIVMSLPKNDPESIELIVNNQLLSNCEKKICLSMLYCLLIVFWHAFIYIWYIKGCFNDCAYWKVFWSETTTIIKEIKSFQFCSIAHQR